MAEEFKEVLEEEKKRLEEMEARIRAQANQIVSKSKELKAKEESLKKLQSARDSRELKAMESKILNQDSLIKNKNKEINSKEESLHDLEKKLRQTRYKLHEYTGKFGKDWQKSIKLEEEKTNRELEGARKQRLAAEDKSRRFFEAAKKAEKKEKGLKIKLALIYEEKELEGQKKVLTDLTVKKNLLAKEKGTLKKELEALNNQRLSLTKEVDKSKKLLKRNIENLDRLKTLKEQFNKTMKEERTRIYLANVDIVKKLQEIKVEKDKIEKEKQNELKRKKILAEEKIKLAQKSMQAAQEELEIAKEFNKK